MLTRLSIMLSVLAVGHAPVRAEPPGAQIAVDFAAPELAQRWFGSALEELVGRELVRFSAVRLAPKLPASACPDRATPCLIDAYRRAGVDIVVLGTLHGHTLAYEVFPVWSGTRAFGGKLEVFGISMVALQRHVGDILRPIVQRGGVLDQRPPPVRNTGPSQPPGAQVAIRTFVLTLIGGVVLLAFPPLLLLLLVGVNHLRRRRWPSSWKWTALAIVLLIGTWVATGGDPRAMLAARLPGVLSLAADWLVPVASGMLWGLFAWVHLRWAFAPIDGIGQVRHDALWTLLRSWIALSLLRAALLLLYTPVVLMTLRGCEALELSSRATWALALPAAGLLACFWLLTLIDNLAFFIDVHLVTGVATDRNPWHSTMRRYFMGYLRRNGIEVGARILDRTLFLPTDVHDVVCYGGGFARPRILVGPTARVMAFGELPDEREAPERQVNPEELPNGVLLPELGERRDPHRAKLAEDRRRALTGALPRRDLPKPRLIGEHLTLLGWVLPQPNDEGMPLIASTQEEYEIVKGLLQEHYSVFERHHDDDEVDDTDPTQKDFLFGALMREIGGISRGDCILSTLGQCLALAQPKASWPTRQVMRGFAWLHNRLLAAPGVVVADADAALHRAMHHLIQYLDLMRVGTTNLTTRATRPQLIAASKEIFDRLEKEAPGAPVMLAPTPRNRLLWLSRFFHAQLGARLGRRLVSTLVVLAAVALFAFSAVRASLHYHPIYVDRMHRLAVEAAKSSEAESSHVRTE